MMVGAALAADVGKPPASLEERQIAMETWRRAMEFQRRAHELYPRRRDTPLRYANMTDDEVREVQIIARQHEMSEFVNISPVVTGCPCEEGSSCTEQVYITSNIGEKTTGLQLSRRKNQWMVGVVQGWWLEYQALLAREASLGYQEFFDLRNLKLLEFPMCQAAKSVNASAQSAENSSSK